MLRRTLPLVLLTGLFVIVGAAVSQEKVKNTHEGAFVKATSETDFAMTDKGGKEHTHTLVKGAKVLGEDGKECKLSEFRKGQQIRVTTQENNNVMVTRVEAIKAKTP